MNESTHYTITVPMRDSENRAAPDVTKWVEAALVNQAGGYTATIVEGGWADADGTLVHDSSTLFSVYVQFGSKAWAFQGELLAIAREVKAWLKQDCVLITRQDSRGTFTRLV